MTNSPPGRRTDPDISFRRVVRLPEMAYRDPDTTFHVTIAAHPEVPTFEPRVRDAVWETVVRQNDREHIVLLAACLMPDHVHLVLRPGTTDVGTFVRSWKSFTTRRSWDAGHRNALWQPGMWDRAVRGESDLENTIRYVIDNPVKAGLVADWQDWAWTWLAGD